MPKAEAQRGRHGRLVGILPDGKTIVVTTTRKSEAFCAECEECGQHFDNNVTVMSVSQKTWFHERGVGHSRFVYYALDELATGETRLEFQ